MERMRTGDARLEEIDMLQALGLSFPAHSPAPCT